MFSLYIYCLWKIGLQQIDICLWLGLSTSSHPISLQTFIEKFSKALSRLVVTISSIPTPSQLIPSRPWSTQLQENQLLSGTPTASLLVNPVPNSAPWALASPSILGWSHLATCTSTDTAGDPLPVESVLHLVARTSFCLGPSPPCYLPQSCLLRPPHASKSFIVGQPQQDSILVCLPPYSCTFLNVICGLMTPKLLSKTWISPWALDPDTEHVV